MTDLPVPPHPGDATDATDETAATAEAAEAAEAAGTGRREALLQDTPDEAAARSVQVVETGHAVVDEVIRSLEGLDTVPVDEHVALFEQAHEQLRRTLSGAGDGAGQG